MYIVLLLTCLIYSTYGYFHLRRNKKQIKYSKHKYLLWIICCIFFVILALDFPFFIAIDKETIVKLENVQVISTGEGRKSVDLITTYEDDSGKIYWSGAPIGQRGWIRSAYRDNIENVCKIKYLPFSRIVVVVNEGGKIVYTNMKDILTFSLAAYLMLIVLLFTYTKENIFGINKSRKR